MFFYLLWYTLPFLISDVLLSVHLESLMNYQCVWIVLHKVHKLCLTPKRWVPVCGQWAPCHQPLGTAMPMTCQPHPNGPASHKHKLESNLWRWCTHRQYTVKDSIATTHGAHTHTHTNKCEKVKLMYVKVREDDKSFNVMICSRQLTQSSTI